MAGKRMSRTETRVVVKTATEVKPTERKTGTKTEAKTTGARPRPQLPRPRPKPKVISLVKKQNVALKASKRYCK